VTHSYHVFGGVLRSELALDELEPAPPDAAATWTLHLAPPAAAPSGEALGSDIVFGDCTVRGIRAAEGLSLVFDDTGRFDVSLDGSRITWFHPVDASLPSAVADITSRVLALALHAGGVFSLHASAVSIGGAGVAFLAPKHFGKSSLCGALVMAGAKAMSDDTVPVRDGAPPVLLPGLPWIRLWSDVAGRTFGVTSDEESTMRKHLISQLAATQVELEPVPFRAAYVLNPVRELEGGSAVHRERLDTVSSTMAVLTHAKLGPILTGSESKVLLGMAAVVATHVPVYRLSVVRDLDRIGEVARTVASWHVADTAPDPR
jgi:hypothetical protein